MGVVIMLLVLLGVKRPRMGLSLSSGSQNEDNPVEVAAPPVSPVMSQVTSEKSRQRWMDSDR